MTQQVPRRLVVVSAGLGQPSSTRLLADRLTEATVGRLAEHGVRTEVRVVELRDHAYDITARMLQGFGSGALEEVVQALTDADAAIAVTPIFTTSYSGLFKSFLDILDPRALTGLPVLLGATGGSERHTLALDYSIRPVFSYLHARPLPTSVYAATADWGVGGTPGTSTLPQRIDRAAAELARELLRPDRADFGRAPDTLALPPGFDPSGGVASPTRSSTLRVGLPTGKTFTPANGRQDAVRGYQEAAS